MPHKDRERQREYQRRYRERNREQVRQYAREWKEANKERVRATKAAWYNSDAGRDSRLRSVYGITLDEWTAMFERQGRRCACCGSVTAGRRYRWATDHDHETQTVRGILCNSCNTLLGRLGDRPSRALKRYSQILRYLVCAQAGVA